MRVLRLTPAGWDALGCLQRGTERTAVGQLLARRLLDAGIAHPRPQPSRGPTDVTIVVPVRDQPDELEVCLAALGSERSVIVVDDGSLAGKRIAEVAVRRGARLIRRPTAGGPAAARNAALAEVRTELVAFVDCDIVMPQGWMSGLAGHFDDPLVAAVAPRVRPLAGGRRGFLERYLDARSPIDMGARESAVEPGARVSYAPTAALLVRRRACRSGFDDGLRYGEDVDLIWRLRAAGWRVRYEPSVVVGHIEPATLARALARRFRYGSSAGPLAKRHPGRLAPAVLLPGPTLVALLAAGRHPGPAALVAARESIALARTATRLGLPPTWGVRWFGEATSQAGLSLGSYLGKFALPLVLQRAWRTRRAVVLGLLALPALDEWRRRAPDLDPLRWTALALLDDAAYGIGVYWGCIRAGEVAPLIPALSSDARIVKPTPATTPSHPGHAFWGRSRGGYDDPPVGDAIQATRPNNTTTGDPHERLGRDRL